MKALVVYESMFGNTEQVADAVADGLRRADVGVTTFEVRSAPDELPPGVGVVVVGAPTHAFSLSRPGTRADAVRQGASPEREERGLREWLETVRLDGPAPTLVAFDTRVTKVRWLPKAAGQSAARLGRRRGFHVPGKPVGFLVDDVRGPLVAGELERAAAWGRQLAVELAGRAAATG